MLAADDIIVSLVGNQVVLTLDPAGTAITNLSTSYASKAGVLTITAQSAGALSAAAAIPGVTIDPATPAWARSSAAGSRELVAQAVGFLPHADTD